MSSGVQIHGRTVFNNSDINNPDIDDGTIDDTKISLDNEEWLSGKNYAGTDEINILKVDPNDGIPVGGTLITGPIEAAEGSGQITFTDMPIGPLEPAGKQESFTQKVGGDNIITVGAFADGAGGVTGHFIKNHGAHVVGKTDMGAANYAPSILTSDYIITVDTTLAARSVTISTEDRDSGTPDNPRIFIIKDIAGNAGTNNITVSLETSGNIDGAASVSITGNYNSIVLLIDGTNGFVI